MCEVRMSAEAKHYLSEATRMKPQKAITHLAVLPWITMWEKQIVTRYSSKTGEASKKRWVAETEKWDGMLYSSIFYEETKDYKTKIVEGMIKILDKNDALLVNTKYGTTVVELTEPCGDDGRGLRFRRGIPHKKG